MKKILATILIAAALIIKLPGVSAVAAGNDSVTSDGQVIIQTEDGVMYLDTATVPATDDRYEPVDRILIPEGFFQDLGELISKGLTFVIAIAALMVFLYLIWGGIDWITSGGDKAKTDQARQKIIAAVIGLIIVAASFAILTIVLNFLGINSLQDAIDQAVNSDVVVIDTSGNTSNGNLEELIEE
ncbi:MAG: hypothetical protein ABFQ62_04470 [Patescibacteria group bacterium]